MTGFDAFLWEFIGTALLLLLGNGVCALVNLRTSGARGSDWIVIALGWGMAVFVGASVADPTGGHLNPAVTSCWPSMDRSNGPWFRITA